MCTTTYTLELGKAEVMTKPQNLSALQATGQAVPATTLITRQDNFRAAISALHAEGARVFRTPLGVEHVPLGQLRELSADGTPYETVARALGVPSQYGPIMDRLEIDQHQLHETVCECHYGQSITGRQAASNLRNLMARSAQSQHQATGFSPTIGLIATIAVVGLVAFSRLHGI